jgi:hypothetical protein
MMVIYKGAWELSAGHISAISVGGWPPFRRPIKLEMSSLAAVISTSDKERHCENIPLVWILS